MRLTLALVITLTMALYAHGRTVTVALDGSGDFRDIQRAIDSLGPEGGTVRIRAGVYVLGKRGIKLRSNLRLVGDGIGVTVLKFAEERVPWGRKWGCILSGRDVKNVTIEGLTLDGNVNFLDAKSCWGGPGGLCVSDAENIRVRNVEAKNLYIYGFSFGNCRDVWMEDCITERTWGGVGTNGVCERVFVRNCVIKYTRGDGIYPQSNSPDGGTHHMIIEGNYLEAIGDTAIDVTANRGLHTDIIVRGNIIVGVIEAGRKWCGGMRITGVHDVLIAYNQFYNTGILADPGSDAGYPKNLRVIGNTIVMTERATSPLILGFPKRVFLTTWENPHPERRVLTLDFVSHGDRKLPEIPILIAITAETADGRFVPVDISGHCNMGFEDEKPFDKTGGWTDQGPRNDMRGFPVGRRVFGGIPFEIVDPRRNNGRSCIVLFGGARPYFPKAVTGIKVGLKVRRLHFLVDAAWTFNKKGLEIAKFVVHYEGGAKAEILLLECVNVDNWWETILREYPEAKVVWRAPFDVEPSVVMGNTVIIGNEARKEIPEALVVGMRVSKGIVMGNRVEGAEVGICGAGEAMLSVVNNIIVGVRKWGIYSVRGPRALIRDNVIEAAKGGAEAPFKDCEGARIEGNVVFGFKAPGGEG